MNQSSVMFLLDFFILTIFYSSVTATDTGTGGCAPVTWTKEGFVPPSEPTIARPSPTRASSNRLGYAQPGEINCRSDSEPGGLLGEEACTYLTTWYGITVEKFLKWNPMLLGDCGNIQPNTKYCVAGFVEPLRAYDGRCGPPNKNATCIGVDMGQCCNSQTWTCGKRYADCEPGNCYEGVCWGHKVYSTDGTCGYQNGNRFCAGKWGNCCNLEGVCGSGEAFCGVETGQSCTRIRGLPYEWGWKLWTD